MNVGKERYEKLLRLEQVLPDEIVLKILSQLARVGEVRDFVQVSLVSRRIRKFWGDVVITKTLLLKRKVLSLSGLKGDFEWEVALYLGVRLRKSLPLERAGESIFSKICCEQKFYGLVFSSLYMKGSYKVVGVEGKRELTGLMSFDVEDPRGGMAAFKDYSERLENDPLVEQSLFKLLEFNMKSQERRLACAKAIIEREIEDGKSVEEVVLECFEGHYIWLYNSGNEVNNKLFCKLDRFFENGLEVGKEHAFTTKELNELKRRSLNLEKRWSSQLLKGVGKRLRDAIDQLLLEQLANNRRARAQSNVGI